jgi:ABC-type phosphate/phosphonate transport system substrate-binding protein
MAFIIFLFAFLQFASPAHAQETSGTLTRTKNSVLRIGFLRGSPEGAPKVSQLEDLIRSFQERDKLTTAMTTAGRSGFGLFACEAGEDMLRRLDAGEFDLAFVPAKTFAQQKSGYRVILQTRRPGDKYPPRGGAVLREGAIFVSPRSHLYKTPDATPDEVAKALKGAPFAVVSTQSVAGFVAPLNILARDFGLAPQETDLLWFDSSEEVGRAVISGLADAGACEAGSLQALLERTPKMPDGTPLARVIRFTEPLPTDPVIVRGEFAPATSELGRQLRTAIREFFTQQSNGDLQFQEAEDEAYRQVPGILAEFENRIGVLRP